MNETNTNMSQQVQNNDPGNMPQGNQQPPKKRKTWLWVLGWIFIFPLPLTLILLKKPDMDKKIKYIIIAIAWVVYFAIGMAVAANNNDNKISKNEKSTVATVTTQPEETTEEETTEEQTEEPTTEKVTENVTEVPTEAVTPFEVVNYTSEVNAGSNASISIKGQPNTTYQIDVVYKSGSSTAEGLEAKNTDGNGNVSWEWEVGSKTTPGTYSITVSGGGTSKSVNFTVK